MTMHQQKQQKQLQQQQQSRQKEEKRRQQQQQHYNTTTSTNVTTKKNKKRLHIMTDDGFLRSFVIQFLVMMGVGIAFETSQVPLFVFVRECVSSLYYDVNEYMLDTAYRYAWWSVIGLLSSSCCALQLMLNSFSLGCAGFNTVLGPIRPTLLAITTTVQASSWMVAYQRPWQYVPTAISTVIVVSLAFLPEFLHLFSSSNKKELFMSKNNIAVVADVTTETNKRNNMNDNNLITIGCNDEKQNQQTCNNITPTTKAVKTHYFHMDNVGCAACVATVSRVLDGISPKLLKSYSVSLEEEMLSIQLRDEDECDDDDDAPLISTSNKHIIMAKLDEAGFPIRLLSLVEN